MRALSSLGQGREAWRPTDCPRHMQGVTSSIQRVVLGHTSGEERNRKQRSHLPVTFAFLPLCSPTKEESEIQREVAGPGLRHRGQQGCRAEGGRGEKPGGMVKVSVDPLLGIDRPCKGPGGLLGHAPFPTPDLSALT